MLSCFMDYSQKIAELKIKHEKLQADLQSPAILNDSKKLGEANKEFYEIGGILDKLSKLEELQKNIGENELIIANEEAGDLVSLAMADNQNLLENKNQLEQEITEYFQPKNPLDKKNAIMEIRAGTGGDESSLFAAELFRTYSRFAEKMGWKVKIDDANRTGLGGFKEIIFEVNGADSYGWLKYESGTHRVQRVPETEKVGRVHTSAVTVAIMPQVEEVDVKIEPKDLKIDTFCAGGHGGQSVNTTDSAVRITYLPTGMIVTCQDEKSQHKNKAKALKVLQSRLLAQKLEADRAKNSAMRRSQIGTGDRSEKIRTYNFPQDRITDHRIKANWSNIGQIMEGDLAPIISAMQAADHEQQLQNL